MGLAALIVVFIMIATVLISKLNGTTDDALQQVADIPKKIVPSESFVKSPTVGEFNFADGCEVAFIDLETTGLDPELDRVIEVGVFFVTHGVNGIAKGESTLANPGRPIPERIIELTGINDAMVADSRPTGEVIGTFLDLIGNRPVAAYNAKFDVAFLRHEAARIGREFNNNSLCVMEFTKKMHPNLRRYRLQDACEAFDIEATAVPGLSAHRALCDTERAMKLYFAIRRGCQPKQAETTEPIDYGRRADYVAMSRYHGIRSSAKLLYQQARESEPTDLGKSIFGYRSAIELHKESAKVQIFTATSESNTRPLHAVSGDIDCLNRLTMCLCKQGLAHDASREMESYFAIFPNDAQLKSAEQIRNRIAKAIKRMA